MVLQALAQREAAGSATAWATTRGLGESQPVAPNQIDGDDNPSGHQLNRRVEIYVRT